MPPRRRGRPLILGPGFWHPQAARPRNFLLNGPVTRRPLVVPVGSYTRLVQGIPLTGGQGATTVSSLVSSSPGLVQTGPAGTGTSGTTVTVTLSKPTTAGNCLIVYVTTIQNTTNPTVSGITLGGSAGNFAVAKAVNLNGNSDTEIWTDQGCAGRQTSVVVSFNAGTGTLPALIVLVEEWSGVVASAGVDQVNGQTGGGTSWSSLATGTLSQANELVVGLVTLAASSGTITGPGSPWVLQSPVTNSITQLAGHEVVSATAPQTYSGTFSVSSNYGAVIVTLKGAAPTGVAGLATISVGPQGLGNVWYPAQVTVSTTSGVNDTSTCQIFLGPAGIPITLLGTIYPGGIGTLAAAVPPLSPGQYLIAQWTGGNPGDVAAINVIGTMDSVMPA